MTNNNGWLNTQAVAEQIVRTLYTKLLLQEFPSQ